MPAPRPFGVGPYGTGHYSRYTGALYEIGGRCTLLFGGHAAPYRIARVAGRTDIRFSLHATIALQLDAAGATQIAWSARALGATRVIRPQALSQILFDAWAEHLVPSWQLPAPCEPGEWNEADPCEQGAWSAPDVPASGGWVTAALCEAGAWDTPPGGATGTWKPVRLP